MTDARYRLATRLQQYAIGNYAHWSTYATPEELMTPHLERDMTMRVDKCRMCGIWQEADNLQDECCNDCFYEERNS